MSRPPNFWNYTHEPPQLASQYFFKSLLSLVPKDRLPSNFFHERAWSRPLAGHKAPTIIPGLCLCGVKVTIKMQKPMKDDVCVPMKTIFTKMQWADLGHRLLFGYPCSRVTLNRGLFCFVFPSFKWTGSRSLADCENLLPLECFMK